MNARSIAPLTSALLGLAAGIVVPITAQEAPAKKRLAILDFEYQTVHSYVYDIFGSDVDIGRGITNLLVTELVKNGTYRLIERQALDQILTEQNFQASGRGDPSTAARLGKVLGVDAIVIGAITQFGRDDKSLQAGGGARVGPVRLGGIGRQSSKATVVVDARLIDVQTAEILAVATGKGESSRGGVSLYGADIGGIGAGGAIDMSSSNFQNTIIGEATRKAVEGLVAEVVQANTKIVAVKVAVSGLVADVAGSDVTVNIGTLAGIRAGETYEVVRPGREIKDPSTGRVIRRVTTPVGTVKITEAGDTWATGTLTGGPAQVGDCVGSCPAQAERPPEPAPAAAPAPTAPAAPAAAPTRAAAAPVGGLALPSGPWTWSPYKFRGTEHFRYDARQVQGGETLTGYYTLDVKPTGDGRFRITVAGKLGDDEFSSSQVSPSPDAISSPMAWAGFMSMGPLAIALFSPVWAMYMGREWEVGSGWSFSSGGESSSFKVESTCQYGGVNGMLGVARENNQVRMQTCVSPHVALPLFVSTGEDEDVVELKLVEYRP